MDPFRYRKAYEAMIHVSQLLETRITQAAADDGGDPETGDETGTALFSEHDDPDSMEWTPTGAMTPPPGCRPPPIASKNLRPLLPDSGDGGYQLQEGTENTVLLHKLQEGVIMDECIDKLVRDLPDILSYENSTTFTPSTIEVPKDFGLQLSISINHHLAQVADRKLLEKYRRLLGHRKDSTKRKFPKLGFDPIDLIKKQAVTFPKNSPSQVSNLDNDIHPVFRPENFHGCSDAIYEALRPALRLSTLLVLSRATSLFWHTLVFGKRERDQKTSDEYGQPCFRIREDVLWSPENAAAFKSFVDGQVDTVHFMFHRDPLPPDPAYASMGLVADYKNGLLRKMNGKCHTSRICLHADFYTTAKKLSLLQYPEPAMVLRFNLFLAVCIAHEMAHFLEVSGPHHDRPLGQPEVFFNDNMWTESGIAFELKVFGGRLHPISSRVDCGLGLAILNYPLKEIYDKEDNILYTLPMQYVTKMQQKETWEQDFTNSDSAIFHVPRTGCRSVEINGTNLMMWEDEKDADISDYIDGKDTIFHRMDDGQIIRNPSSNNRKPPRQSQVRRWIPYARKKNTLETGACVSRDLVEDDTEPGLREEQQQQQGGESDRDEEML
ncbi:uncharacterized protein BDR25DRAFT_302785 [Lindgomyces ingoldianus]|uniref:Uncharacterized protein n=1 Tax=Lindgomyces ingoldianus TaxID=673940 RepID=A0ACB6QY85_9PLEO|nr:uncharacterized protein BDR25DRAFT_302785 [Lindgomyces ingoldianus]KAF2471958.1 hypothetical protein BDR25DRAFT_302785 [Lindgomyces ingoldianus]